MGRKTLKGLTYYLNLPSPVTSTRTGVRLFPYLLPVFVSFENHPYRFFVVKKNSMADSENSPPASGPESGEEHRVSGSRVLAATEEDGVCLPPVKPKTGRIEAPVVPEEAAEAFCCLSSDWHGCEATWNLADKDGFVDVLRQDAKMCAPFTVDELRRSCYSCLGFDAPGAHQPVCHCCSRLDELEFMRTLSDGRLELKLEWPGTLLDFMHWKQRMNPAQFDLKTRAEQYEWNTTATEAEDYEAIHAPYFEANYWGGLEYGGTYSLLDGSYNRENDWWYAVGSFQDSIPSTQGDEFVGDAYEDTFVRRATLKAKPDYTYFQPKCISCEACYDSDGYWRGETTTETWQNTTACTLGQACAFDRIVKTTVPGCPAICRGMRIRAFEARAAHHEARVLAKLAEIKRTRPPLTRESPRPPLPPRTRSYG